MRSVLDETGKKLLNLLQEGLPICPRPYLELGKLLGIDEEEVLTRINAYLEAGLIRRLGGVFDSRKLGYTGTLCAVRVPPEKVDEVARVINSYPGVTHNYLREHTYNIWFTVLAQSRSEIEKILEEIKVKTEIGEILELPAVRVFKIKASFAVR